MGRAFAASDEDCVGPGWIGWSPEKAGIFVAGIYEDWNVPAANIPAQPILQFSALALSMMVAVRERCGCLGHGRLDREGCLGGESED